MDGRRRLPSKSARPAARNSSAIVCIGREPPPVRGSGAVEAVGVAAAGVAVAGVVVAGVVVVGVVVVVGGVVGDGVVWLPGDTGSGGGVVIDTVAVEQNTMRVAALSPNVASASRSQIV